ncbi:hypothetical protein Q3A66_00485 [Hymenobacter sp. BT770]|uniref:hypothetical protein n=1 Tax=Hymenobacter sp. BT770 TaxID=2886942 RepID=UPI001D12489D|nr:hypothetical protein [Hymenobacter sp. BT770]MCC3151854.1 hypothetical protein [Hymenobacter sp. BT770]MDO3413524.1 hypothetical protein [Hymenobacter sp. BT770]
MKFSFKTLLVLSAFGAFATTSCSEKKADDAATTTENAASDAGNAMDNAVDSAKADIAREPGDTAVVRNKPADKVIEEVPATKQK